MTIEETGVHSKIQKGSMFRALANRWRGYSEPDMNNVKERLSESKSGGIYVTGPEKLALRGLRALGKTERNRKPGV